jgi:hypothetical protein
MNIMWETSDEELIALRPSENGNPRRNNVKTKQRTQRRTETKMFEVVDNRKMNKVFATHRFPFFPIVLEFMKTFKILEFYRSPPFYFVSAFNKYPQGWGLYV